MTSLVAVIGTQSNSTLTAYMIKRVLLIATRQIGDVLLATPLLRSLRVALPDAVIDVLVYKNKGQMLEGNIDCDHLIEVSERPSFSEYLSVLPRLFKKYDLAVNTLAGDRPHLFSFWSAWSRVSVVADKGRGWKSLGNTKNVRLDNHNTHTVLQNLLLADLLKIEKSFHITPPFNPSSGDRIQRILPFEISKVRMAVVHPMPMWVYKRWPASQWLKVIDCLLQKVDQVVITGGPDSDEKNEIDRLVSAFPSRVYSTAGQVTFAIAAELIKKSEIYVGPDTAMTHLAASVGVKTIAIYGPTNPVKWGPWPYDWVALNPWIKNSPQAQTQKNVFLVQATYVDGCVPCAEEGCNRHKRSHSNCLNNLKSETVCELIHHLLAD